MKIFVKDHFGRQGYSYDRYEIVDGKRKKIKEEIHKIPTVEGHRQAVDLYAFLKLVEQAEERYGELRNVMVCWSFEGGSHGVGGWHKDYDPGYTIFWIEFERLETDTEQRRREGPAAVKEEKEKAKVAETKKLLAKQLSK